MQDFVALANRMADIAGKIIVLRKFRQKEGEPCWFPKLN
jgi:hypothetical protein